MGEITMDECECNNQAEIIVNAMVKSLIDTYDIKLYQMAEEVADKDNKIDALTHERRCIMGEVRKLKSEIHNLKDKVREMRQVL